MTTTTAGSHIALKTGYAGAQLIRFGDEVPIGVTVAPWMIDVSTAQSSPSESAAFTAYVRWNTSRAPSGNTVRPDLI